LYIMVTIQGFFHPFELPDDIEHMQCDTQTYPWCQDANRYVLIRVIDNNIECLFVQDDVAFLRLDGTNPFNLIKEIARRNIVNLEHMGYVACEIMRAKQAIDAKSEFVQR